MISRLVLIIDLLSFFRFLTFLGRPCWEYFETNAYANGGGKKSQKKVPKGSREENEEKAPVTGFHLKEEKLRLPSSSSSEDCKFCIGSNTHWVPEARWRIYTNYQFSLPRRLGVFLLKLFLHQLVILGFASPVSRSLQ